MEHDKKQTSGREAGSIMIYNSSKIITSLFVLSTVKDVKIYL